MGNQAILSLGDCGEFEASNLIPITWLSLFVAADLHIEKLVEDGEEYEAAKFQTSPTTAVDRVKQIRNKLEGKTPIWPYLRPIEILQEILVYCPADEIIELDVTQFWQINEVYRQRVASVTTNFEQMMASITSEEAHDLSVLDQMVNDLSLNQIASVADLDSEDKMFVLIGTYWGDEILENKYSLEFFDDFYWGAK